MTRLSEVAMTSPTLRLLSLGAGVQSTALALMASRGLLGGFGSLGGAVFADTGWEPRAVYAHLDRLGKVMADAGIPVRRVSSGNIRQDALNPHHRFASMPLFLVNQDGKPGMGRRQCTSEYKLRPIREEVRRLLGAADGPNGRPGRVPGGRVAEVWVGISADEADRARDAGVAYVRYRFPLLGMGWTRGDCLAFLAAAGWGSTPKSACIGCPFHTNRQWRHLRDNAPADWADAVAFDHAIRQVPGARDVLGDAYLHRSRIPLDRAPIDRASVRELAALQGDVLHDLAVMDWEERLADDSSLGGCGPLSCTSGEPVAELDEVPA